MFENITCQPLPLQWLSIFTLEIDNKIGEQRVSQKEVLRYSRVCSK